MSNACYPSWEAVYEDNVTWVYRTIFARVGDDPRMRLYLIGATAISAEVARAPSRETPGRGDAGRSQKPSREGTTIGDA